MGNVPLYQHSDEAGEEPRWWYAKIRPAALNHRTANSEGIRSTGTPYFLRFPVLRESHL